MCSLDAPAKGVKLSDSFMENPKCKIYRRSSPSAPKNVLAPSFRSLAWVGPAGYRCRHEHGPL